MSKGKDKSQEEIRRNNGSPRDTTNGRHDAGGDPDSLFADGKLPLSQYIAAKKNVTLSGSYKLDAPVIVDGEEIVISGGNKPALIESAFSPAFSVKNGGRLTLTRIELRMPDSMITAKEPLQINILGRKFNLSEFGSSNKGSAAVIEAVGEAAVSFNHSVIEGASGCGISLENSEFFAENSEISHCRATALVLKNSSAAIRKSTIAENGTRGLKNAQVLMEKSSAVLERATIRTSRGGDGCTLKSASRVEIKGGAISGNAGNGLALYDSSSADVADCKIMENGAPGMSYCQVYFSKSSATIRNCNISESRESIGISLFESKAVVESCSIKSNTNRAIAAVNSSTLTIRDSAIKDNGLRGKIDTQIYLEQSSAVMEKCSVNEARGNGVTLEKESRAVFSECTMKGNAGNAIAAFNKSRAEVKECRLTANGKLKKVYAQIFLDQSAADISNCEITDCVGGPGIALFRWSEVSVSSCVISRNGDNGITVFRSPKVEIRDCKMMWNGTVGDCYCHIYLEMANAVIERCQLYESHYGYAVYIYGKKRAFRKNSFCDVTMNDCVLEKNKLGLRVDNLSRLSMTGCKIAGNKEGDTYYEGGAVVTVDGGPAE